MELVRGAVLVQAVAPVEVKGMSQPVRAFRLLDVAGRDRGIDRALRSRPLVGRERELQALRGAFDRAVSAGTCQLVTVVGPAGIGKTRLTRDFVALARRCSHGSHRPLPLIRAGPDLLAAARDRGGAGRHRGRRQPRRGHGASRPPAAGGRRPGHRGRARGGGTRGGGLHRLPGGDVLGGAQAAGGGRARAPSRGRPGGHPVGRAHVPRVHRVPAQRDRRAPRPDRRRHPEPSSSTANPTSPPGCPAPDKSSCSR